MLGQLGAAVQADWAVLFLYFDDGRRFGATHSWSDPRGPGGGLGGLRQPGHRDAFPWLREKLSTAARCCNWRGLDQLPPEAAAERYLLQLQGVRSMLVAPLKLGDQALGFVGCAHLGGARDFASTDSELLPWPRPTPWRN